MSIPSVKQLFVDIGEVFADEFGRLVADIEVDVIEPVALDLAVDWRGRRYRAGPVRPLVIVRHEAVPGAGVEQVPAFAAHRLGDQEVLDVEVVEAGRVELHHFHVGDARSPRARPWRCRPPSRRAARC
jgi:hypothetical protein